MTPCGLEEEEDTKVMEEEEEEEDTEEEQEGIESKEDTRMIGDIETSTKNLSEPQVSRT